MTDRTFDVSNDTHDDKDTRGITVPVGIEEEGDVPSAPIAPPGPAGEPDLHPPNRSTLAASDPATPSSRPPDDPYEVGGTAATPGVFGTSDSAGLGDAPMDEIALGEAPPSSSSPARRTRRLHKGVLVSAAAAVTLAAGLGLGHLVWRTSASSGSGSSTSASRTSKTGSSSGTSGSSASDVAGSSNLSSVADEVDRGLVDIDTTLGYAGEEAAGTGMVLTSSGEILTNNHVIAGATSIRVTDIGNGKTYSASVVGYDETLDIAVLQLQGASGLQTISIGNSSTAAIGETVIGIGNAGGTGGTPSAASGAVTALDQSITASDEADGSSEQLANLIEMNADIQAGDSGGPLVNSSGEVIGMDTAASEGFSFQTAGSSGIQSYAIPINEALTIAKDVEAGSSSSTVHIGTTAFLGVEIDSNATDGGTSTSGAVVAGVVTDSPASEAGIATGSVITSLDGHVVDSADALSQLLEAYHSGATVTIEWTNSSGQSMTAAVVLSSEPAA